LQDKYYLGEGQYEKFKPPTLEDTKLLSVANSEFKQSRMGRLITIHGKVRDMIKINLKTLEKVVMINEEAKKFSTTTVIKDNRMVEEYGVDEIDDIIVNTSNSKKVAQTKDIRFHLS